MTTVPLLSVLRGHKGKNLGGKVSYFLFYKHLCFIKLFVLEAITPGPSILDKVLTSVSSDSVIPGNEGKFGANYVGAIARSGTPVLYNNDDSKQLFAFSEGSWADSS